MDQIQREKIAEKLKKIKALAERGVGGEKETAMRMYEDLKARYEIEAAEITLLFNFYKEELKRELKAFMIAFKNGNDLFPDKTARCYKEYDGPDRERTDEEERMMKKAAWLAMTLDKRKPPRALLGEAEVEED